MANFSSYSTTPEDRLKAYMRNVGDVGIDPSFSTVDTANLELTSPEPLQPIRNMGVGSNQSQNRFQNPNYGENATIRDFAGGVKDFVSGLANKFGISQQFGNKSSMYASGSHPGLDIRTPVGTEVISPIEGKVVAGYDPKGWGRYVQVQAPDGTTFQFSHLSSVDDLITQVAKMKDGLIKKGQILGKTGGAKNDPGRGKSTGAHLDISAKRGGKFINPLSS